jgi:DNA-binding response OmpR family regulator
MKTRLLLVEDEDAIAAPLLEFLRREGFDVLHAGTTADARSLMASNAASLELAILDWMLPDGQGIDLLRDWRRSGNETPVIFLTARHELIDKVLGFELGADDYVTKPFEARELLARLRARLRRPPAGSPAGTAAEDGNVLECGDIRMDLGRREVTRDGQKVELTKMEFELLRLFLDNPDQVFSRDEVLNRVWGYESYPTTRTVDTHVLQLRQKFGSERFETVRGIGYRFMKGKS